jgi:hypothetical protein
VTAPLSQAQLEGAHSWVADDVVPGRPAMTEFRRTLRYRQSRWRDAHRHPIGTRPIRPRPGERAKLVGSRLPLAYALETGATFVTDAALAAARYRTSFVEREQSFDHQRLWADLLWSPTLAFNLFGDLAGDLARADRAVHSWWPDAPGTVREVRFAHSPGRLDPAYLNSLRSFDAAFVLDVGGRTQAVVGVDVRYHDRTKAETPKPENLWRTLAVAERSGVFADGAIEKVKGRSDLAVMWLEHLLLLSMLQHVSGSWTWGRYVVIHPAGNVDYADACDRYRGLLADESTFGSMTLEALLDTNLLPAAAIAAVRERYVVKVAAGPMTDEEASGIRTFGDLKHFEEALRAVVER